MLIYSHWWFASSVLVHVLTQVQSCALGSCSVLDAADGTSCKDAKARLCQPLLLPLWWSLLRMHSSSFTSFGCLDAGQEVQVALERVAISIPGYASVQVPGPHSKESHNLHVHPFPLPVPNQYLSMRKILL